MCLEKIKRVYKPGSEDSKRLVHGYKLFIESKGKLHPFSYNTLKPFKKTKWNVDCPGKMLAGVGWDAVTIDCGFYFFKTLHDARSVMNDILYNSKPTTREDMLNAVTRWGSDDIRLVIYNIDATDLVAEGLQWENRKCIIAKQIRIRKRQAKSHFIFEQLKTEVPE